MIKNKKHTKPHVLELKAETIVHLAREKLKDVVGGSFNSTHPSQCVSWC